MYDISTASAADLRARVAAHQADRTRAERKRAELTLPFGRRAWVQVARGSVRVNGEALQAGDGAALTGSDGKRVTGPPGSAKNIGHIDKGPEQNVVGFRNTAGEFERPHGEWNTLEMVVEDQVVKQYVNGTLANVGTDPFPTEGKILFQSEGAEIFFRNFVLYPLK